MMKYTQAQLRELVRIGAVSDITDLSAEQFTEFKTTRDLEAVGYSLAVLGIPPYDANGCMLKDKKTGDLFIITEPTNALYMALYMDK